MLINTNLVKISASDGAVLDGMFCPPSNGSRTAVIHLHGLAGNFYENCFIAEVAGKCANSGIGFLSVNLRSHDYLANVKFVGQESRKIGAMYEVFEECICDIEGLLRWCVSQGVDSICLQGHSSGANKAIHAYLNVDAELRRIVRCLALLAPADDVFAQQQVARSFHWMRMAQSSIDMGDENALLPSEAFYGFTFSARTYINLFSSGGQHDVFRFRDAGGDWPQVTRILCPVFVSFGKNDPYVASTPLDDAIVLREKLGTDDVDVAVVAGDHSFSGGEVELGDRLVAFLKRFIV